MSTIDELSIVDIIEMQDGIFFQLADIFFKYFRMQFCIEFQAC